MLKAERHRQILDLLKYQEFVKISELSQHIGVSEMTIRRDLEELELDGFLIKVHGGARKLKHIQQERSTNEKIELEIPKKEYIGKVLNSYIPDNCVIYLPAGTTIFYSLPFIQKNNLTIITNSLIAFEYLTNQTEYTVHLIAGEYLKLTNEFVGQYAESFFRNINIDIAFASTNGVYNNFVTTSGIKQASLQRIVFEHSRLKYLVADSTKFNKSDMYTSCELKDLDGIITDNEISAEIYKFYSKKTKIITKERSVKE